MKYTNTKNASKFVNALVYGRAGVGKTTLITTVDKPIIISSENGLLSIADSNLPVIIIDNHDDLLEAFDYVSGKKARKKFSTVVLDSISDIAETTLSSLKKSAKDPRRAYGDMNTMIADSIRDFRDLPINSYFIAKAEMYENSAGLQAMRPSMPGKTLTNQLSFFFDEVLCLRVAEDDDGDVVRFLQTQPSATVDAKDRSGKLKAMEKPDLGLIFKKLQKSKKK